PSVLIITFYSGLLLYTVLHIKDARRGCNIQEDIGKAPLLIRIRDQIIKAAIPLSIAVLPILVYFSIELLRPKGLHVTFIDVGQGDAAVVELPDAKTLVIDTGRGGFEVGEFLKYRGVRKIDALILSHGQSDHAGGAAYLSRRFAVNEIWDNGFMLYPSEFKDIRRRTLQRGDIISGTGYRLTVLHPYEGFYTFYSEGEDDNNSSLVIKIKGRNNSFLFTGDIEDEAMDDLMSLDEYLKSDVLKAPHHGSRSDGIELFVDAVSNDITVISVGRGNPYGHPHEETLEAFMESLILRTDRGGAIGMQEINNGLLIKRGREFILEEPKTMNDELMNIKGLFNVW
ncbi:MAG: MBL fold metallo-hydrolase, partial [Nitrospirae bacterium]|nr:MBL fold metallo-hydrolase [Nitrospirota bacterium]